MKTWLIGIGVFLVWATGSTYWYVCKIQGQCWEGSSEVMVATIEGNDDSAAGIADTAPATPAPDPAPVDTAAPAAVQEATPPSTALPAELAEPHTVLFAFAGPLPENPGAFEAYLDQVAAHLQANAAHKVLLRGYTDDTAARENNIKLAAKRCEVIAAKLRERGISDAQISTEPLGEADPVATNDTQAGRRLNRRVVISILQ